MCDMNEDLKENEDHGLFSLSGLVSLTDLLEELPLPTPIKNTFKTQSLIHDAEVFEEAKVLLSNDNDNLVQDLITAMTNIDTDDIELIEESNNETIDMHVAPLLLKAILSHSDQLKEKNGFAHAFAEQRFIDWADISHQNDLDCGFNQMNYNLSDIMSSPETSKSCFQNHEKTEKNADDMNYNLSDFPFIPEMNKNSHSPHLKTIELPINPNSNCVETEKKHKSEKHEKKRKKKKKKDKSEKQVCIEEENQYSIKKPNSDSQKIVLSLVKLDDHSKKHKRKRRKDEHKERSKENTKEHKNHVHKHRHRHQLQQQHKPLEKIKLKVIRNGDNAQIVSSTISVPTSKNNVAAGSSSCHSGAVCDTTPTSSCVTGANGYGTPSTTTVDRVSQCSTSSLQLTGSQDQLWSGYKQSQDDQFDLSIMPIDITGPKSDYLFSDIIMSAGDDLLSPLNLNGAASILGSDNVDSFLDEFDPVLQLDQQRAGPGGLASYLSNGLREPPVAVQPPPPQSQQQHRSRGFADLQASRKYKFKKQKKRKNELEGLKTWFIGGNVEKKESASESNDAFSAQESTWDKTINNITHSISQKAQKRKRNARNNKNSAYIFDNDEEYSKATSLVKNEDEDEDGTKRSLRNANSTTYTGMDELDENDDDFPAGRAKRRKKDDDDEPFEVKLKDPNEIKYPHLKKSAQESSRKRRERVVELTKVSNVGGGHQVKLPADMLDPSLITESSTYQHLLASIDSCLEVVEDLDLTQMIRDSDESSDPAAMDTLASCLPQDALISRDVLQSMSSDVAKLKAIGCTKDLPIEKLTKLSTLLMLNIRSGSRVCLPISENETDEVQNRLYRELAIERIGRSLDASFIAMNIMTSPEMAREVFIEDVIESVVGCVKYHLSNLVFPEYDPAYRAKNSAKDNQMSIKWKRARERETTKSKSIVYFYNRIVDIIASLSELINIQSLTDSVILQLSTIGVSVFFVENINEVQLVSLRLITMIFSKYEKHRDLIVKDIFSSLNRLPSSKKNLRNYRLNSEESIQMLTALSLMLVQSVVNAEKIRGNKEATGTPSSQTPAVNGSTLEAAAVAAVAETDPSTGQDREIIIENCYNNSLQTAYNFLNVFLQKSTVKGGEDDYKVIFDNFVTDLLLTVNKPEWPAAETMLRMLGCLLMNQFTNKQCDQSTRVTCIDYMGNVAATLRRDAVSCQLSEADMDAVVDDLVNGNRSSSDEEDDEDEEEEDEDENEEDDDSDLSNSNDIRPPSAKKRKKDPKSEKENPTKKKSTKQTQSLSNVDRVQVLRDAILDYLEVDKYDLTSKFARQFYFGEWFSDCSQELKRQQTNATGTPTSGGGNVSKASDLLLQQTDDRKKHLYYKMFGEVPPVMEVVVAPTNISSKKKRRVGGGVNKVPETIPPFQVLQLKGSLDYENACLACRYLASLKSSSQSFNIYITRICRLLDDNSVAVRTKSMRCLSAVVEADPGILSRKDIELAVHRRFFDSSTSVREAALELVGKYLMVRPQLIDQYYPMIAERILDKGTSVRKRVIRIFRDICIEQSNSNKIPEICVKMIKRINDEESIKKLVNEVFQNMWFCPVKERETVKLLQKVMNITDVVNACSSTGYEWFDQLLDGLLKREDSSGAAAAAASAPGAIGSTGTGASGGDKVRLVERACKQIVDCLVENIMRLEEISNQQRQKQTNERLVSSLCTLHLFTKVRPQLMLQHAVTLQPYLSVRKTGDHDVYIITHVARILELTVPLIEHPAEHFISQLEEDMVTLMMTHGKMVVEACAACFSATVNRISRNYSLVRDCFQRLYHGLVVQQSPSKKQMSINKPLVSRALFTVGLLCKHFDFNLLGLENDINSQVFETLMVFAEDVNLTSDIRTQAILGIGFLCVRHKEILYSSRLSDFYHGLLLNHSDAISVSDYPDLVCCVLDNISLFLIEEDKRMRNMDSVWKPHEKKESLKEMGDILAGVSSRVAQLYLADILENMLQPWTAVRCKAVGLVSLITQQGLLNPITAVPYLIAAQTDPTSANRVKADNELADIDKRCNGYVNMKAVQGIKLSCHLQETLGIYSRQVTSASQSCNWFKMRHQLSPIIVRGLLDFSVEIPLALNNNLYTMVRSSKQNRRAFLYALLAIFNDPKSMLSLLIYVSDNLAQFPYQSQEEPLYLVHQIDILVSSLGPNHIQHIKEALYPEMAAALAAAQVSAIAAQAAAQAALAASDINDTAEADIPDTPVALTTPPVVNKKLDMIRFDDEDDPRLLQGRLTANPGSLRELRNSIRASRGCLLLIALKTYLRELYSLTDAKVQKYSPSDTGKAWERQLTRRSGLKFEPILALELDESGLAHEEIYQRFLDCTGSSGGDDAGKIDLDDDLYPGEAAALLGKFLQLRQLVNQLDSLDIEADSDDEVTKAVAAAAAGTSGAKGGSAAEEGDAATALSHQSAVAQGLALRVQLSKLDPKDIPQYIGAGSTGNSAGVGAASTLPRRSNQPKKTLVPRLPIASSDEESDDALKDKQCQLLYGRKKTANPSRPSRRTRTSRYQMPRRKSKSPKEDSSHDSDDEDNLNSDPDFVG